MRLFAIARLVLWLFAGVAIASACTISPSEAPQDSIPPTDSVSVPQDSSGQNAVPDLATPQLETPQASTYDFSYEDAIWPQGVDLRQDSTEAVTYMDLFGKFASETEAECINDNLGQAQKDILASTYVSGDPSAMELDDFDTLWSSGCLSDYTAMRILVEYAVEVLPSVPGGMPTRGVDTECLDRTASNAAESGPGLVKDSTLVLQLMESVAFDCTGTFRYMLYDVISARTDDRLDLNQTRCAIDAALPHIRDLTMDHVDTGVSQDAKNEFDAAVESITDMCAPKWRSVSLDAYDMNRSYPSNHGAPNFPPVMVRSDYSVPEGIFDSGMSKICGQGLMPQLIQRQEQDESLEILIMIYVQDWGYDTYLWADEPRYDLGRAYGDERDSDFDYVLCVKWDGAIESTVECLNIEDGAVFGTKVLSYEAALYDAASGVMVHSGDITAVSDCAVYPDLYEGTAYNEHLPEDSTMSFLRAGGVSLNKVRR